MRCPEEMFYKIREIAPAFPCYFCIVPAELHTGNGWSDTGYEKRCGYFEVDPSFHLDKLKSMEYRKVYVDIDYKWQDPSPALMAIKWSPKLEKYLSFEKVALKCVKFRTNPELLSPGTVIVGQNHKNTGLVVGVIKADRDFPNLPSISLLPTGIAYEVEGTVLGALGKPFNGSWFHPSIIVNSYMTLDAFEATLSDNNGE